MEKLKGLDFQIEKINANPGANNSFQPEILTLTLPNGTLNFTVQGRTSGRDGCDIKVLDEDNTEMMDKYYSTELGGIPIPRMEIAHDICETMEILIGEEHTLPFSKEDIYPAVARMVDKCESRYGNKIPNSTFESQIIF